MHTQSSVSTAQPSTMNRLAMVILCAIMVVVLHSAPVNAADAANRQQAIQIAQQQNGGNGKVLGVNTEQNRNGTTVFAVKILTNGRVRVYRIKKAR